MATNIGLFPRVNWSDGQVVTQEDMTTEQAAVFGTISNLAQISIGSGVEKGSAVQNTLFDSYNVPSSIQSLITSNSFDGTPIYPNDTFGNVVYTQPSDTSQGNQLQVTISNTTLSITETLSVYIFGIEFGGTFVQEVLNFDRNDTQITYTYFTSISAIMFQNFLGNGNTLIDGYGSLNVGGRCVISEALPLTVARDVIMASQTNAPNLPYVSFKPANPSTTLQNLLTQIANSVNQSTTSLNIQTTPSSTRTLAANQSVGIIVAEKFQATTNNIQKITILLSVQENTLATPGNQYNFSGDIVVGIRALQTTLTCPTDVIPGNAIGFDPEPSSLAEVSLDQATLADQGIVLNGKPQPVDFVFTQSSLGNPAVNGQILVPQSFYAVTIRRSGDISTGNIVLTESLKNTYSLSNTIQMETVFSNNVWSDIPTQDLWFEIYTDAIRITSGTAVDQGVQITSPKITENTTTGTNISFVDGHYSMIQTTSGQPNYIVIQKQTKLLDQVPSAATGNLYYSRAEDLTSTSVITQASLLQLINAGTNPIVLGSIVDTNPVNVPLISGTTLYSGLVGTNTFTIINPTTDLLNNNIVGALLTPNTGNSQYQYRVVGTQLFIDAYGDANGDGVININDVNLVQALDGYSKNLQPAVVSPMIPATTQQQAIASGQVSMLDILRGNVTGSGTINIVDAQDIQQYIQYGSSFPVGATFKRLVLTVENVLNPSTSVTNIIGNDPSFNGNSLTGIYTPIDYTLDVAAIWDPENLIITDLRRFVLETFTSITDEDITGTPSNGGSSSVFVPGNLLINGQILNEDGTPFSIDLEITNIVLELPAGNTAAQVDIFNNFVNGQLKFSDGTYVTSSALTKNQVIISAAIQSLTDQADLSDPLLIDNNPGIDQSISILYTNDTGILTIRAQNIVNIITRPELRTKIILTVYLKKAGFINNTQEISANTLSNYLISI